MPEPKSAGRRVICALSALLSAAAIPAQAGSFTITNLVNSGQTRPDGLPWYVFGRPSIDAGNVVFLTANAQVFATLDGIWAIATAKSLTPVQMAGLNTPMPHGTGNFVNFGTSGGYEPTAAGGTLVFYGRDSTGLQGIYAMPETGGRISRIVDTATGAPGGGTFTLVGPATTNGPEVAFYGQTSAGHQGIYSAGKTGHGLRLVIDNTTTLPAHDGGNVPCPDNPGIDPVYYGTYSAPVYGKARIAFFATGIGDPSQYPNAIFTNAGAGYAGIADNCSPLQGDTAPRHVQITGYSADRLSATVAFGAFDGAYAGIFATQGSDTQTERRFVTTAAKVPGTKGMFTGFGPFAFDSSGLAFIGNDAVNGQSLYFTPGLGRPVGLVAAAGQFSNLTLSGRAVSGGQIVLWTGSIFFNAIYLAAPAP